MFDVISAMSEGEVSVSIGDLTDSLSIVEFDLTEPDVSNYPPFIKPRYLQVCFSHCRRIFSRVLLSPSMTM